MSTTPLPPSFPRAAWLTAALAGFVLPALALLLLARAGGAPGAAAGTGAGVVLAVGMMGAGMIAAAIVGRLWSGVVPALLAGAGLIVLARSLGMPALPDLPAAAAAMLVASISFAARGALFARSAAARGWWIALGVVGGEAAVVATAWAQPEALPAWLLALLPAQWATTAIQTMLAGGGIPSAAPVLLALGGTAATTLLVARLWPRRWPYLIMFSTWLALSAFVHQNQTQPEQAGGHSLVTRALPEPSNAPA